MKKGYLVVGVIVALMVGLVMAVPAVAAETATQDECVIKVKEAAELVKTLGKDAALAKLSTQDGGFVWKDTYVFALDLDTSAVSAHPIKPKLVGKMLTGMKDVNGKLFFAEFMNVAKAQGDGWVDYMWPKPGEKTPSAKSTYVYRVPGASVVLLAGIYK